MFIYGENRYMTSINLKNSTFYNVIGGGQYFIDFGSDTYGPSSFNIENCLFSVSLLMKLQTRTSELKLLQV